MRTGNIRGIQCPMLGEPVLARTLTESVSVELSASVAAGPAVVQSSRNRGTVLQRFSFSSKVEAVIPR
jgi:hypothetical protein